MKVVKFGARSVKGQDFEHELSAPVTVFAGRNFKGKTTRVEALGLALLGYAPVAGRKPVKAPRKLFDKYATTGHRSMSAWAELKGHPELSGVSRSWTLDGKSVRYEGPDGPVVDPYSADPAEYLTLSGPEQTRYLFKCFAAAAALDPADVLAGIASELKQSVPKDAGPEVEKLARERAAELKAPEKGELVQQWLEELAAWARDEKKLADQNAKRMAETVRGNAQTAATAAPVDPAAEGAYKAAHEAVAKAEAALAEKQEAVRACRAEWSRVNAELGTLCQNGQRAALLEELRASESPLDPAIAEARAALDKCDADLTVANSICVEAGFKLEAARKRLQEVVAAAGQKECPHCHQPVKPAKSKKDVAAAEAEQLAAEKAGEEAMKKRDAAKVAHAEAKARLARQHAIALVRIEAQGQALTEEVLARTQALSGHRGALAPAEAAYKALMASRAEKAARAKAQEEAEAAKRQAVVAKLLVEAIEGKLVALVAEAVAPLVDTMNRLCAPILTGQVSFRAGEITLDGREALSDAEELLVYAAICVALATASSGLRLCTVGRLESFDYENRDKLLRLLVDLAKQGHIDQSILVCVQTGPNENDIARGFDPDEVRVVTLR